MSKSDLLITEPTTILDHVFQISQVLAKATHWKPALDEVVPLLRQIIIFDNLVLYLPDEETHELEVAYARIVGRGRSVGPDINWGEVMARQAFDTRQMVNSQPETIPATNERLELPYVLAAPFMIGDSPAGALVLLRFGGPSYTEENTRVIAFLVDEIAQILRYQTIDQRLVSLETEKKQARLQEDFVSTITHELLTPLGFIKGYTTTLMRPDAYWDESTTREFLAIIDQETDRLQELIDNMLDSARLQSGNLRMEFQPVRLDVLLRDVVMRSKQHNQGLDIDFGSNPPSHPIQGDPRRLAQVFENLVTNAIKYAPESRIRINVFEKDDIVQIDVTDEGPGIPTQYVPHLFERFYRNPEQAPNVRGTGLGLYICRQIIQAHNGEISINSKVGEGTTVRIDLPYMQPSPVEHSTPV